MINTDKILAVCEDNMVFMEQFDKHHVDIAIADPEYGISESMSNFESRNTPVKQKNGGTSKIKKNQKYFNSDWDASPPPPEYFDKLFYISKNQIVFGANYFSKIVGTPFKPPRRDKFEQFLKENPRGWIIWDKVNSTNDFNDCELIWTSFDFESFILPYMWSGMMQGLSITEGTIQQGNKQLNEKRIHPTQKPVPIYKFLLHRFAKPGDIIYDPNFGSGSLIIACHDYEFNIFACEKDSVMFSLASSRINKHISQLKMFTAND